MLKIGQGGVVTTVGAVTGDANFPTNAQISGNGSFNAGDLGDETCTLANCQDILFIRLGTNATPYTNRLWAININTLYATTIPLSQAMPNASDIVFFEGYLWAVHGNVTAPTSVSIYRINPVNGQVNQYNLPTVSGSTISTAGIIRQAYGAQWRYGNGNLGISGNDNDAAYQIKITNPSAATPTFTIMSALDAPRSQQNDGASYRGNPVDLSITKEASPSPYVPGEMLTYTLTVTNNDGSYSSGSIVTDTLPADLLNPATVTAGCSIETVGSSNVLTCALGALAGGESSVIAVKGTVSASANVSLSNTATVLGNERDDVPENNTATVVTQPRQTPQVNISKTANTTAALTPGSTITYTVTVTNTGTAPAPNTVVNDALPAGITSASWTCASAGGAVCPNASGTSAPPHLLNQTIATFPAGGVVTYTITATAVTSGLPAVVTNMATANPSGGVCANGSPPPCSAAVTNPAGPVVDITKTANVSRVAPGETIIYQIRVENVGSVDAADVVVSDPIPAGVDSVEWVCSGAACPNATGVGAINDTLLNLAADSSVIYTVTAKVSNAPPDSVVNTATVTVPDGVCGECAASAGVITERTLPPPHPGASVPVLSWWSLLALMALLTGVAVRMRRYV
ncbi:MAG: DUF11 domain-containing protein [Burkholderiales bacterium]|nr:DUF11 domain-containing protein [Burkholderiales bacterium]